MCGIVGAVAQRDVAAILLTGLQRLEYRGYDSAGFAIANADGQLQRIRRAGRVQALADAAAESPIAGGTGIAHTRWATHGEPSERNAHPHICRDRIAVVHNGIIENHAAIREALKSRDYAFESDTDTEVISHLVHSKLETRDDLLSAAHAAFAELDGAYGAVILDAARPDRLVAARSGSPLVIGFGIGEHFLASDPLALLPVTRRFAYLEEGDVAEITRTTVRILDADGQLVERPIEESMLTQDVSDKGRYRHFMQKEIHEQPVALQQTIEGRLDEDGVPDSVFGPDAGHHLAQVEHVQIIACGTSYHAGLVARYWLESLAGVSCRVEIASEYRYRDVFVHPNSLLVTISQSGETADTLAALRLGREQGYVSTLAFCNVDGSSLVRESDMVYLMRAGTEIGVASTKAFTVQLAGLLMLTAALGRHRGKPPESGAAIVRALRSLPMRVEQALALEPDIEVLAEDFADKQHSLFLGRGDQYPIAMEGALKLKEISYIHAEAYAAGELKHGPLALIDADMPVIVMTPNNALLEKLRSNVEEVRARGGLMYVFADDESGFVSDETMTVLRLPHCDALIAPVVYTVPLQLLSYHVALIKGTDVDQPRNLAKSVTVE